MFLIQKPSKNEFPFCMAWDDLFRRHPCRNAG
jgi:hypothetical protein